MDDKKTDWINLIRLLVLIGLVVMSASPLTKATVLLKTAHAFQGTSRRLGRIGMELEIKAKKVVQDGAL